MDKKQAEERLKQEALRETSVTMPVSHWYAVLNAMRESHHSTKDRHFKSLLKDCMIIIVNSGVNPIALEKLSDEAGLLDQYKAAKARGEV